MLDKLYDPAAAEARHYARWEQAGLFSRGRRPDAPAYTIVIPPPNVTGRLHMGHALNNTLQDILVRRRRMQGYDTLWQPGTDHAGIATQMVVERRLEQQGQSRHALGRDRFLEKIWEWKAESGGAIADQQRRLGASCDWSRERFTMDEGLSNAVRRVFVSLYREGIIYRDKRLVNWDPKLETAISDLEVEQKEVEGHLWYFRYPVVGAEGSFITVATTRPETMLGDSGIAVHPEDGRYAALVGKFCRQPLTGAHLPVVADAYADPEQGSGAVKITPAHDFNDFEVGRRHGLEMVNIFTATACLNDSVPEKYRGMDRFAARDAVVEDMRALGLLEKVEDHLHKVPYGDRGGVPVEPYLTDQWFLDAARLAGPAMEAVRGGQVSFVPAHWSKTYFDWMNDIRPWCISRQLWWGHRIPAWYGPDGAVFVAETDAEAAALAQSQYGASTPLRQDDDVLDTWFSSALWPFSTMGWPDDTPDIQARHYPTDVLLTGFDIIFFWVARMMMMGLHFTGKPPFHTVYVHALVRDAKGAKMAKSKGNVIDPLLVADEYGADALRLTLAMLAAPGRDIRMSPERVAGSRNFITKLWNAARLCEMNGIRADAAFDPATARLALNRWIAGALADTGAAVDQALEIYHFHEASATLCQFVRGSFCDWYLEFAKPVLEAGGDDAVETQRCAGWVLGHILHLMHPFIPFVTEELWERLGPGAESPLIIANWPESAVIPRDTEASAEMTWIIELIAGLRSLRSEMNISPAVLLPLLLRGATPAAVTWVQRNWPAVARMARLEACSFADAGGPPPRGAVEMLHREAQVLLPLAGIVDLAQEAARLTKAVDQAEKAVAALDRKLANPDFVSRAPEDVVEENRTRLEQQRQDAAKLHGALARVRAAL